MNTFGVRGYSRGHNPQKGITFVEVAIVLPIAIFFVMGIVDFGLLMLSRYEMASVASTIARRIQDTPRINLTALNTFITDALAGLKGTDKTVGIASYTDLQPSGWFKSVPVNQRNYSLDQDDYFVGVVVRMKFESSSIMSPFLKKLIPEDTYVSSALVPVKNLQNCGPDRVLVSDNQGSYLCGPNCGPGQMPVVNAAGNQVVCSPAGANGQLLSFGPGGSSLVVRTVPACSDPGDVLRFDGTNFKCENVFGDKRFCIIQAEDESCPSGYKTVNPGDKIGGTVNIKGSFVFGGSKSESGKKIEFRGPEPGTGETKNLSVRVWAWCCLD